MGRSPAGITTPGISDVDLLVALADDLTLQEFQALDAMHHEIVRRHPDWDNRVEIAYLTTRALQTFKAERSKIGIISPGEPFHQIDAGIDWLMNWHMVQEIGITLYGVPPRDVIAPTTRAEFVAAVRDHAAAWREWVKDLDSRPFQAYAIITLCRAWYTVTHGEQTSKAKAAAWAAGQLPEWRGLIEQALAWRRAHREPGIDPAPTLAETQAFVLMMVEKVTRA